VTFRISGSISNGAGATVSLSGAASATTTADASGNYSFHWVGQRQLHSDAEQGGLHVHSASQAVTINGANQTGVNFTASAVTFGISGSISNGAGATVSLSGAASATTTADASGNYSFTGLANGSYTVTPSKAGFTFTPASQAVTINGANQTG